jgi:hypothetical protein
MIRLARRVQDRNSLVCLMATFVLVAIVMSLQGCNWYCDSGGCYAMAGGDPQPTPGPYFVSWSPNADWNNQNQFDNSDCLVNQVTQFGTFTRTYNIGGTVSGPVFYYIPNAYQNSYLEIDTSAISDSTMKTINSGAITVWANAIATSVPLGNYYTLTPQETTSGNGQVTVASSSTDPGYPGITAAQLDNTLSYMASASITYYMPEISGKPYDFYYQVALHEIGHSQGLAHNPDEGSIMFPSIENDSNDFCFHYNASQPSSSTKPPGDDTNVLVAKYDPIFHFNPIKKCTKQPCPQSSINPNRNSSVHLTWAQVQSMTRDWPWIHLEDPLGARELDLDGLWLASSLIVEGQVGQSVEDMPDGTDRVEIVPIRIARILRRSFGPDGGVAVGQTIYVADNQPARGGEYLDDQPLRRGSRVILFLRRQHDLALERFPTTVYRLTAPFVSKWVIDGRGLLRVAGSSKSRISDDVNGRTAAGAMVNFAQRNQFQLKWDEHAITDSLLRARGFTSQSAITAYETALARNPIDVVKWMIRDDRRRFGPPSLGYR